MDKESLIISLTNQHCYDNYFSYQKYNLLSNIFELNSIFEKRFAKIILILYFFKEIITKILYECDEIINIDNYSNINKFEISFYFYLSLLIKDTPNIINYTYSIDALRCLNKLLKKDKENKLEIIIISKIGIDLLNNYKNTDSYDESESEELTNIEEEFYYIIKNNINIINDFNLNYTINEIISEKIDIIYIEIILYLIKQGKFENYENTINILKQMDLENIKLTKIMFDKLNNELSKNGIILNYQINEPNDLFDEKKINFYNILFKYILKEDSFYIYQISLLMRSKKAIINMIKNKLIIIKNLNKESKTFKVIKILVDSNYYLDLQDKKSPTDTNLQNKLFINEISTSANIESNYFSENHQNFIYDNNDYLKEQKDKIYFSEYEEFMKKKLTKSSFLFKSDKDKKISIIILNEEDEEIPKKKKRRKKTNKIENDMNNLLLNFKKFLEFILNVRAEIERLFKNHYNLLIKMKFNKEDKNDNLNSLYNITCRYIFFPLNGERLFTFIDENILVNGINQGFPFLINEINYYTYEKIEYNQYLDFNKIIKEKEEIEEKISKEENEGNSFSIFDIVSSEEVSEYKIIEFKQIISCHLTSADYLYKLSNGYYVSGGNQREIFIYDQQFKKIEVNLKHKSIGICEIKYHDSKNILKIIAYSYECLSLISYETHKYNTPRVQTYPISASHLIQIERNKYIINNEKDGYISEDFTDKKTFRKIFNYTYHVGIKINEKLSVFTSNRVMPNGKDRLIIYDIISNKIVYELEGYSFSLSQNSLLSIKISNSFDKEKILICACKKYSTYQKNGILLVNTKIEDNQDIFDGFYETYNFEPYCFSKILLVNKSYENKKSGRIYDTNYFFVGGFDQEKGIGAIKLYKINYEHPVYNTTISFIQDINLDSDNNFKGFNGSVTSIVQTHDTGNFLISCSDGHIFLFSPANLNYFLFYDEETKDSSYEKMKYFDKGIQSQIEKEENDKKQKFDNSKMFNELFKALDKNCSFEKNLST